MANADIAL